ncbi:hypothetical protein ACFVUH_08380 [Kitasatospora sp. NPDC058032]|uniref:hypothetical protein n=1 Tax=Kitasatospora sp. NPDC058032 TaxID=3346307 RepID=UPI0036DA16EB
MAAAQLQSCTKDATPEELQTFRTALAGSAAALEEAAQALLSVARHLDGPEPKVLRDLNSRPAGAKAASTARSRPRPPGTPAPVAAGRTR